jgi:hypothetical protein
MMLTALCRDVYSCHHSCRDLCLGTPRMLPCPTPARATGKGEKPHLISSPPNTRSSSSPCALSCTPSFIPTLVRRSFCGLPPPPRPAPPTPWPPPPFPTRPASAALSAFETFAGTSKCTSLSNQPGATRLFSARSCARRRSSHSCSVLRAEDSRLERWDCRARQEDRMLSGEAAVREVEDVM